MDSEPGHAHGVFSSPVPELPEVETVARLLAPDLVGRCVREVSIDWPRSVGERGPAAFRRATRGARIERVGRRGKYLIFDLTRDGRPAGALVGHLRMTGRMEVVDGDQAPSPWRRVSLGLDDGRRFDFVDPRKFGRLEPVKNAAERLSKLGPEPLSEELDADWFQAEVRLRKRQLKPLLLDQEFLAGLGNIYVDESLFRAGLHPLRRSDRVPPAKARLLFGEIRATLSEAIEREGSSFDAFYRTPTGQPGSYQAQFQVYGRQGQPCRRCGRSITKLVVGQRGTHLCTRCQPAPRG